MKQKQFFMNYTDCVSEFQIECAYYLTLFSSMLLNLGDRLF